MSQSREVLQAALKPAPRERAELVEAIAASLDGFDLGEEWRKKFGGGSRTLTRAE